MKSFNWIVIVLALSGCATLQSPNTFVACRAADVATTAVAIHGGAVEENSLMAHLIAHGWLPFVAAEVSVAWFVYKHELNMTPQQRGVVNTIGCAPIPNNLSVIARMK